MRNYTFYLKHTNKKTIIYYLRKNNYILTFSKKTFSHVFGGVSTPYTLFYKTTSSCFGKQFLRIKNSPRACFSSFFVVSLQHFAQHASKNKNKMEEKDIKKQASEEMVIKPIAHFHSPLKTKFGVPKQSGLASSLKGVHNVHKRMARSRSASWHRRFRLPVAHMGLLSQPPQGHGHDRAPSRAWRQQAHGHLGHALPFPSQQPGAVVGKDREHRP